MSNKEKARRLLNDWLQLWRGGYSSAPDRATELVRLIEKGLDVEDNSGFKCLGGNNQCCTTITDRQSFGCQTHSISDFTSA